MCRLLLSFIVFFPLFSVFADNSGNNIAPAKEGAASVQESSQGNDPAKPTKSKGRVSREKDTEGTQAPHHFDSDILFKSKYELDGKALEVDTD